MNDPTLTAEQYGIWLIQTMTALPDGAEFNRLKREFDLLTDELEYLERCYRKEVTTDGE